jgi:SAM-dependent methyltransferase
MHSLSNEQKVILNQCTNILTGVECLVYPEIFGKNFSERVIEAPWVAHHAKECSSLLDIGFTFASFEYLGMLLCLKEKYGVQLSVVDIIKPESIQERYPEDWISSILEVPITVGDVRFLELPPNVYDIVTCISTIEHIGFDKPSTTVSGSAFERKGAKQDVITKRDPLTNQLVLDSIHRALKPGGKLLISVPMGRGGVSLLQDSLGLYCAQWEYEEDSWKEITNHSGYELLEQRFFLMSDIGWQEVDSPVDMIDVTSAMKRHAEGCAVCALVKK